MVSSVDVIPFLRPDALADMASHGEFLRELGHGIEKESLRVDPGGALSKQSHPIALGSALTHPHITTDFSEAQLELITDVHPNVDACLAELHTIHRFVSNQIGEELLWPSSMPCILGSDADIPLGRYGSSNIGRAKTIYRNGLGHRYGRLMQTISGIHYNFSLPESYWAYLHSKPGQQGSVQSIRTDGYLHLIRNFRRCSWLLVYLFGASPAVCKSFVKGREHQLSVFDEGSLYLPHGTSLRMGRLGYQSDAQADLHVSYNSLSAYTQTIVDALTQPYPDYQAIGVHTAEEGYRQLNDSIIQIENEFYGAIRPKQPVNTGERPLLALKRRGVAYVEVRCLDLNPFKLVGIGHNDARFLDSFLLYCLLSNSAPDSPEESQLMQINQQRVVETGRAPGLMLETLQGPMALTQWASAILDGCAQVAALQDRALGNDNTAPSATAVQLQRDKIADPSQTPSARVLAAMATQRIPFFRFAMNQAKAHRETFATSPLRDGELRKFQQLSKLSLERQAQIEANDNVPFEAFLEDYLALSPEARN